MADAVKKGAQAAKDKVSGNRNSKCSCKSNCICTEVTSGASYEANKAAAKDSNQPIGDRISSGKIFFDDLY